MRVFKDNYQNYYLEEIKNKYWKINCFDVDR